MSSADATGEPETRWSRVQRLSTNDEAVWEWFVQRYEPFVQAVLAATIRERELSANAAADFWAYLFTSNVVQRADPSRSFRAFLIGTLRRYAKAWLRRASHTPPIDQDTDVGELAADTSDLEDAIWSAHVIHCGLTELAHRHPDHARILRWFYGVGESPLDQSRTRMTATAIADRLGKNVNAVHQAMHVGRSRLRALVAAELRETVATSEQFATEFRVVEGYSRRRTPGLIES